MKIPRHFSRRSYSQPGISAFTLPELLVVIAVIFILGEVIIPGLIKTKEASMLASCSNNLRQIGVGCNIYATANNDYWPTINLPGSVENFYQTELACRTTSIPGTQIAYGPYGFGQLFFYAGMNNPQVFYCPSIESGTYAYSYYDAPGYSWPAMTPIAAQQGDGNPFVRCGYNYYPQSKITTSIATPGGTFNLPVVTFSSSPISFNVPNPPGGNPPSLDQSTELVPMKTTQINLSKAVAVDSLKVWALINHEYRGQPYGVNALFPDGHVRLQPVAGNNKKNSNKPFDPELWDPVSGFGEGPSETSYSTSGNDYAAGIIMAGFQP
jgi:prepilin-type processing-associated H-X9-DG protein